MVYALTSLNKRLTLRRLFGGSGVPQNTSRAIALCGVLLHPHLGQGTFATQSPITCPKRRQSLTLYAIRPKFNIFINV